MKPASPFYDSTAAQAFGAILATLLGVIVAIWVQRNVWLPKRRLYYGISETIPLLASHSSIKDNLEVRHKDVPLAKPRLVTVRISVRGRQDIASDDYDGDHPLQISIGAPIVATLDITSKPDTSLAPRVVVSDSGLPVGPSLIQCGQTIKISVLVDTDKLSIACKNPLKNVKIQRQRPDDPELAVLLAGPHNLFILGAIGGIAALMIAQLSKQPLSWIPFIISLPLLVL